MMAKLQKEFEARGVSIYALSIGSKMDHRKWVEEVEELQDCKILFPIICDVNGSVRSTFNYSEHL